MVCMNPTGHMVHLQTSLGLSIFFDVLFSFRWMGTLLMLQLIVGVLRVRQEYIGYFGFLASGVYRIFWISVFWI